MTNSGIIFIGIAGTAVALDRATGIEVWRSELKGSDFVNVALHDGDLFAATHGELFCLDAATGNIRWQNSLKGLGWGLISIASADSPQAVLLREQRQREGNAAAGTSTTT